MHRSRETHDRRLYSNNYLYDDKRLIFGDKNLYEKLLLAKATYSQTRPLDRPRYPQIDQTWLLTGKIEEGQQ